MKSEYLHRSLCCVDPGTITGWALFRKGKLTECGKLKKEAAEMLADIPPVGSVGIVERPRIYSYGKKGDKANTPDEDIVKLALLAGECRAHLRHAGCDAKYILPYDWKGHVPKPKKGEEYIIEKRVWRILDDAERAVLLATKGPRARRLDHNIVDAIGMGLQEMGRECQGSGIF